MAGAVDASRDSTKARNACHLVEKVLKLSLLCMSKMYAMMCVVDFHEKQCSISYIQCK